MCVLSVRPIRLGATQLATGGGGWRRGGWGRAEWRGGGRPEVQLRSGLPADPEGHHPESAAQGRPGGAGGRRARHPLPGNNTHHNMKVVVYVSLIYCEVELVFPSMAHKQWNALRDSKGVNSITRVVFFLKSKCLTCLLPQGKNFIGDLLNDGKIRWVETGQIFNSPSAWATHCKRLVNPAKKSGCGWASVRYRGQKLVQYKTTWLHKYQPSADMVREDRNL